MIAVLILLFGVIAVCLLVFADQILAQTTKHKAHRETGVYTVWYHLRRYTVPRPSLQESPYWDRFPNTKNYCYGGTLDDPVLKELADSIMYIADGRSNRWMAGFILALVQQNCTYRTDYETFGDSERYAFPICAMYLRGNDCEDSAYWGCALSRLCGLDAVMVRVKGHMAYGVYVLGIGVTFKHADKTYIWCESTSTNPMGIYTGNRDIQGTYDLLLPPEGFIELQTHEDSFERYKR